MTTSRASRRILNNELAAKDSVFVAPTTNMQIQETKELPIQAKKLNNMKDLDLKESESETSNHKESDREYETNRGFMQYET